MTVLYSRLRRRRAYLAVALLLALLAHLAAMTSPLHARAMAASEPAHHAAEHAPVVLHSCDTCTTPLPEPPVVPQWDVCGLEATLPVAKTVFSAVVAVLPGGERQETSRAISPFCSAWRLDPSPTPPSDRQALLQVFRL